MKHLSTLAYLALLLLGMASCKNGGTSLFAPASSGRPYEMLVVMDDSAWERPAGRALFDALDTDVPGLPQSERSFLIMQIDESQMNNTFRIFRNIIVPKIDRMYSQVKFKFARDVNASPQVIMTIQAPSEEAFAEYVGKHKQTIVDLFTRAEMNRQVKLLKKDHSLLVEQLVRDSFQCTVHVPADLQNYKRGRNFLWATTNREKDDLNFVIYSYPFTDRNTFTLEYFIHKRDSFMKANLPGPLDGSYMATDENFIMSQDISVRGKYAQEIKGLWEMEGAVMGGPFVSHVRVDEENQRVIVAEAFVYSPGNKKRDIMRRMEASLYTLQLPGEQDAVTTVGSDVEGVEEEIVEKKN
ncbi:MAG: DUF4837 family protein [Bacteroidaceae bacterium]|nr:DUF4837 family protein [Bacteroidaceae bacterium]